MHTQEHFVVLLSQLVCSGLGPRPPACRLASSANRSLVLEPCGIFPQASPKSMRYAYLTHIRTSEKQLCTSSICILPDLRRCCYSASREMSLFSATPPSRVVIHCADLCLASSDSTNSSLLGTLAWPSAQPPAAQQLFQGMNAHTLHSRLLWLAASFPHVSFTPLYSIISFFGGAPDCKSLTPLLSSLFGILLVSFPFVVSFPFCMEQLQVHRRVLTRPGAVVITATRSWIH